MDKNTFKKELDEILTKADTELSKLRGSRIDPEIVYGIMVEAYGGKSPIRNIANVSVIDAKTLTITPWDKGLVDQVFKDMQKAEMSASYVREGDKVRVIFPDMTQERRQEMVKMMLKEVEDYRVSIRNIRQKYMQDIDAQQKSGLSEDLARRMREEGETETKDANQRLEKLKEEKEKEILTV